MLFYVFGEAEQGQVRTGEHVPSEAELERSALAGFRLEFLNGSHKLKQAGVLAAGSAVDFRYGDNDGNDPIKYTARYVSFPEADVVAREEFSGEYHTGQRVGFELGSLGRDGAVSFLQGFHVALDDGQDHHISRISVLLDGTGRSDGNTEVAFDVEGGHTVGFRYTVQVIWLREETVWHQFAMGGTPTKQDVTHRDRPRASLGKQGLLRGFDCRYVKDVRLDGDRSVWRRDAHHVDWFWVDLDGPFRNNRQTNVSMNEGRDEHGRTRNENLGVNRAWFMTPPGDGCLGDIVGRIGFGRTGP